MLYTHMRASAEQSHHYQPCQASRYHLCAAPSVCMCVQKLVCVYGRVSVCVCVCVCVSMQAAALKRAEVQSTFARPGDAIDLGAHIHPQRPLTVTHPHQGVVTRLLQGDRDGTKYGFIDYAVNLVYLPQVRDCVRVCVREACMHWCVCVCEGRE